MEIKRGLEGVVVDETRVSLVDGEHGVLAYRGRNIDDLVGLSFGQAAELVVDGTTTSGLAQSLFEASELSPRELDLVLSLPRDTHPMHVLQGLTPLLDPTALFADRGEAGQGFAVAAKMPALLAAFHLGDRPAPSVEPDPALRFLELIGRTSPGARTPSPRSCSSSTASTRAPSSRERARARWHRSRTRCPRPSARCTAICTAARTRLRWKPLTR